MLAIAAFNDYEIWQMDVKTEFFNGYLKEELYMMQPVCLTTLKLGLGQNSTESKICIWGFSGLVVCYSGHI